MLAKHYLECREVTKVLLVVLELNAPPVAL